MKKYIILTILTAFYQLSFGQSPKTQIGWYHLLPGSKTKILVSYNKATNFSTNVWYATDEVLMIFEYKNNIGYAIDIDGRILQIDNMDKVKKIDTPSGASVLLSADHL